MKKLMITLLACTLFMVGCANNPSSTPSSNGTAATVQTVIEGSIPFIRPVVAITCTTVLNAALDPQDRVDKANIINSISTVVASLAGGSVPTVEQLQSAIVSVAPTAKTHWATLVTSISSTYSSLYTQYIKGDVKLAAQILQQISLGCTDATGVTVPVTPITPPVVTATNVVVTPAQ